MILCERDGKTLSYDRAENELGYEGERGALDVAPYGDDVDGRKGTTARASGEVRDSSEATTVTPILTRRNEDAVVPNDSIASLSKNAKGRCLILNFPKIPLLFSKIVL